VKARRAGVTPPSPRLVPRVLLVLVLVAGTALAAVAQPTGADAPALDVPAVRIAGPDRVATGEQVLDRWAAQVGVRVGAAVVVVPRDATAVALSAAGLAGAVGGAVVLSDLPPRASTVAAVRRSGVGRVLAVGGGAELGQAWAAEGFEVDVVHADGGAPAVAAQVARALPDPTGPRRAYLAGTAGLPDALAAGPAAHREAAPLLLTAADVLDPHTRAAVEQLGIAAVTVVGGDAAVGAGAVAELQAMGVAVDRLAGPDREATALAVAAAGPPPQAVLLAAGDDPADAAGAAALAAATGAVVLPPGATTRAWLADRCGTAPAVTVLGGEQAVPAAVEAAHRAAAQRCDGLREAMSVRVAVATPGAPDAGPDVVAAVTGPDGWGGRRLRLVGVGEAHHVGVVIADPGACGGPVACRRGRDLVVDGGAWAAADPARRLHLLDLLVGGLLGEPVGDGCAGAVMDPPACPPPGRPTAADRARVADRFVPTATLAFAGDVHGERHIAVAVAEGRNPLAPVAGILASADVAVLNLETPLSTRGTPASKTYTFRGPPALAADLAEAGVDVVSLANNHALDYGVDALVDTLAVTAEAGVRTVGAGLDATAAYAPALVDTPAGRVAVVGVTRVLHTRAWEATATRPGLASAYDEPAAVAAVQAARAAADVVVVAVHWGTERADCPDAGQRHLARLLTDAGADLVIGHHPHVLQGVQHLDGAAGGAALVAYSLGNFVWYHDAVPSRFTGVLQVELPLLEDAPWSFAPAQIGPDGSPHPAGGSLGDAITARVRDRSPGGAVGCAFP
jgi:hypothetical protein